MTERLSRSARRQILKDDEPWVGKPLVLTAIGRALQANTRHLALMLRDTRARDRASQAAAFAAQLLDVTLNAQVKEPVACGKGCSHCCGTLITATIPEILRLARDIKGEKDIVKRVLDAAAMAKGLPQSAPNSARIVCPILEERLCARYVARPLVCRSLLSGSLAACIRIFEEDRPEGIPLVVPSAEIRAYVLLMLQAALRLAGLPHRHYELIQGLAAALSRDDAEARWLAGEPVFDGVEIDQADARASRVSAMAEQLVAAIQPSL